MDTLNSLDDLELFNLHTKIDKGINPDCNASHYEQRCRYYTPHSYQIDKTGLAKHNQSVNFSVLHNNVRSLNKNLLNELNTECSFKIGISETQITDDRSLNFNPNIAD